MTEKQELKEFHENHPWPDHVGIKSLFRFYKINENHLEYLDHIFIDRKLYHSLPQQFNDPFECKPRFNWPSKPLQINQIRRHLIKVARRNGLTRKSAESLISEKMQNSDFIQTTISNAALKAYGELRICSYTTKKENLLFWSHYADSHKGFCVEFDASKMPIAYAFKVKYQDEFPEMIYPPVNDARGFKPALIKSKAWEYEEEFRTIFVPEASGQPSNDGQSLILKGDEIKRVYLGAYISETNKERLIDIIERGPFNPEIWTTNLSQHSFEFTFKQL